MSQNATIFGLLGFALLLGGIGAYGGYTVGFERASLQAQAQLAEKEKAIAEAKAAAPAPGRGVGTGEKAEKVPFEPTSLTAGDLASYVPGLSELSGESESKALYILNNVVGACVPCFDQQYSIGKCLQREGKLLDRSLCADVRTVAQRVVRLAKAGKSPDEIKEQTEFSQPWMPIDTAGRPSKGPADAPVTIIEYSDFQCPYCKKAQPSAHAVEEKYKGKVRFVFMHLPLAMHKMARPAALAAAAADKQGKFFEYHDALFASEGLDDAKLVEIARELGLDVPRWDSDRKSTEIDKIVTADQRTAEKWKLSSTPTFFVNGYKIKGAQSPEFFSRIIDAELADPS
jgi:protein-disulfide isomerase